MSSFYDIFEPTERDRWQIIHGASLKPEYRLILAILEDAVHIFQKYAASKSNDGKNKFTEAEDWIFFESSKWIFSFKNVSEYLNIDSGYFRKGLRKWQREYLEGVENISQKSAYKKIKRHVA